MDGWRRNGADIEEKWRGYSQGYDAACLVLIPYLVRMSQCLTVPSGHSSKEGVLGLLFLENKIAVTAGASIGPP